MNNIINLLWNKDNGMFVLAVISLAIAIWFNIKNKKQTNKLIAQSTKLLAQTNESISTLNKTTQDVEAIAKHLSFGGIDPFPLGLKDVITLLAEYKKTAIEEQRKFCLDIYTDVPGYAVFSHNILWNNFYDCLKNICSEQKIDFPIFWYFYSDNRLEKQIREQFNSWKEYDLDQLKKELYLRSSAERLKFKHGNAAKCRFCTSGKCQSNNIEECEIILELKQEVDKLQNKNDVPQFVENKIFDAMKFLHNNAIERIKQLSGFGKVRYGDKRLDENLPFFAWIILEEKAGNMKEGEKKHALIPVEGIVSYNYYDEKKEAIENGFRTSDHKLIRSLYDIVHSNAKHQLEKLKQQSQQKEG
ncbi:MAG: hypothetical protein LBE11_07995 [Prevotellaceae bacterium]|jgi:hypothetical protein|nr:hypothetical protein [Prevotellaceae bacterium]